MIVQTNTFLATLSAIAFAGAASAGLLVGETIGVDFGDDPAVGSVGNFNVMGTGAGRPPANLTIADLIDLNGNNTGVGATVDAETEAEDGPGVGTGGQNSATGDSLIGLPSEFQVAHVTDWIFRLDSITFTGLDDSLTYDLAFVIGGFTGDSASNGQTVNADGQSASLGTISNDPRIATLTGLSSTGGELFVDFSSPSGLPVGSALTLTAVVPEPGSLALLGLGGLAMLCRRRL